MRHRLVRGIDVREDAQGALEIYLAVFIGAGVARGPVEKLNTEALLELADILADRRARQPQLPAGFGKASELDHFHEGPKACELVHVRFVDLGETAICCA